MNKLTLALSILVATLLLVDGISVAGMKFKIVDDVLIEMPQKSRAFFGDKFGKLNKWLETNVSETESFEANLRAAAIHLKEIQNKEEQEIWRHFTDLIKITKIDSCNQEAVDTLRANARNGNIVRKSNQEPRATLRAQRIVYHYLVQHAKDCEPIYEQKYREKRKTFQQSEFIMVSALAYLLRIELKFTGIFRPGTEETIRFLSGISRLPTKRMSKIAMEVINKNHSFEQQEALKAQIARRVAGEDVDQEEVKSLLQSLFDKCHSYMLLLEDTLRPASYDAATNIKPGERYGGEQLTNGIANYKICERLLKDQKAKGLISGVMVSIPKHMPRYMREKKKADPQSLQKEVVKNSIVHPKI